MYVCVCKAVTDKQLKCAITEDGLCSRKQLRECLGVGSQCGKCNKHLKALLVCHSNAMSSSEPQIVMLQDPMSAHSDVAMAGAI